MTAILRETPIPDARGDADCVAVHKGAEAFEAIRRQNCAATIWCREPLPGFQSWINGLRPDHLPQGRLILQQEAVSNAVHQLCEIAHMPAASQRDLLVGDIAALADLFSNIMRTSHLRLRLDKVTDNACSKFHKDAISARLVCTYRGTGTQYGISTNGEEPSDISIVPTGSPMMMRGTLWPEAPKSGFLHRSPPIEKTGETRLVLVLDPISNPDEEI